MPLCPRRGYSVFRVSPRRHPGWDPFLVQLQVWSPVIEPIDFCGQGEFGSPDHTTEEAFFSDDLDLLVVDNGETQGVGAVFAALRGPEDGPIRRRIHNDLSPPRPPAWGGHILPTVHGAVNEELPPFSMHRGW